MQLRTFWVVTKPQSKNSTITDILGQCTPTQFIRQVRGGLSELELDSIHSDIQSAELRANVLLAEAKLKFSNAEARFAAASTFFTVKR